MDKLNELTMSADSKAGVDARLLKSEMYWMLKKKIKNEDAINDNNEFWDVLENEILKSSPLFRQRLELLSGGKMRTTDYRTAMLVKCGITPTEISKLMSRSKSAISNRRKTMGFVWFGKEMNPIQVDKIIRCL